MNDLTPEEFSYIVKRIKLRLDYIREEVRAAGYKSINIFKNEILIIKQILAKLEPKNKHDTYVHAVLDTIKNIEDSIR